MESTPSDGRAETRIRPNESQRGTTAIENSIKTLFYIDLFRIMFRADCDIFALPRFAMYSTIWLSFAHPKRPLALGGWTCGTGRNLDAATPTAALRDGADIRCPLVKVCSRENG